MSVFNLGFLVVKIVDVKSGFEDDFMDRIVAIQVIAP